MNIRVTIDCFSGRENPWVELSGKNAADLLDGIAIKGALDATTERPARHRLGYRGIIVERHDHDQDHLPRRFLISADRLFSDGTAAALDARGLEQRLVDPARLVSLFGLDHQTAEWIAADAGGALAPGVGTLRPPPWQPPKVVVIQHENPAPVFEPAWWNDGGARQHGNNCYNYACDYRTETFAQPGRASGHMYPEIAGAAVKGAAVFDDLVDTPAADNHFPAAGHLVALVIAPPHVDFHWYRKDLNGKWSHKPGGTAATNLDSAGHEVIDPRTASRGPYTEFVTFMNVKHGHVRVR
jgi:hypothetical protein